MSATYELIRASAGSGKTFQLSGHFLKELFSGHSPETILATTFTRKAAGEILGRVLLRLAAAAEDQEECCRLAEFLKPVVVTQAIARQLLVDVTAQLHRMRVCTLDSFFQQVARSLTLELGLVPGWKIIDEHADRELRQQAIDAVLAQQIPKDAQRLMQMLAKGCSKRSVRELIDDTVADFYDLFLATDESAWNRIPRPHRRSRKDLDHALREISAETPAADETFIRVVREDRDRFDAEQWDAFVDKGIAAKVLQNQNTYSRKPVPGALLEAYQPLVQHAKAELLDQIVQQNKAIYDLIARFDREYCRLRTESGWMGFGDVTRILARTADVASGSRMNFRLDSSLQHLLLDEFQDTSPEQWDILRRLAQTISRQKGASSFFCVGDQKQAIYGWRGGVAEILNEVPKALPQVDSRTLDESRRSSVAVIETVNRVFTHIHQHANLTDYGPACFAWQQSFPLHTTFQQHQQGYVRLRTSPEFEGTADERRAPWHQWVARHVQELHQQCPGAEIGILTRTNRAVARLVHQLNLIGVPASEEGGTAPTDSPAVLAVLSLLHMASHPGDRIARFHVSQSPLAGPVELTNWDDDTAAVRTASEIRARLMDSGYGPTLQWISEAVRPSCNQRDILRLQQIVAEGWKFDNSPSLNPADFVRLLENSRLSKSEAAPVRVMTVHQSKGLEFDIVVLPELETNLFRAPKAAAGSPGPASSPDRVCVWRNKTIRGLLPESMQEAFEQTVAADVAEALCLLYVALTRAKHAMHLLIHPVSASKTPASFAGVLLASLTTDACAPADQTLFEIGNPEWFLDYPQLTSAAHQAPPAADSRFYVPQIMLAPMAERRRGLRREAPSKHQGTHVQIREERTASTHQTADLSPRTKGTLLHAWFETIPWLSDEFVIDIPRLQQLAERMFVERSTVDRLLPQFMALLNRPGTRAALTQQALLKTSVFKDFAADIKAQTARFVVEAERPFVLKRQGTVIQGTIDRLVLLVRNGQVMAADIVDFKTDRLSGDPAVWVAEKTEHYRDQLEEYRSAVSYCFGIPRDRILTRLLLLEADALVVTKNRFADSECPK